MTDLESKAISRRVPCDSGWLRDGRVIITLDPRGYIGFREPRRRQTYKLSMAEAFRQAVVITNRKIQERVRQLRRQGVGLADARKQARKELL